MREFIEYDNIPTAMMRLVLILDRLMMERVTNTLTEDNFTVETAAFHGLLRFILSVSLVISRGAEGPGREIL